LFLARPRHIEVSVATRVLENGDVVTGLPESGAPPRRWHALDAAEALDAVKSDAIYGLSSVQAQRRLDYFGPNALPGPKRRSLLSVFLHQFKSPMIYLLFAAAGIALALKHVSDAAVIFAVLLINAIVGAVQEGRAERSLQALRKLERQKARLVRDGQELVVDARDVTLGDVLLLEAGDAVAADARLVAGAALQVAEAALTGESLPVAKGPLPVAADTTLGDRRSMVYAGTHVTAGRARAVIVEIGLDTEVGHIAQLSQEAVEPKTPLELRIAQFGRAVIAFAAVLFVLVNLVGFLQGHGFGDILMVAIGQVVSMIPEGLPVAMTVALAVGVHRMARRKTIVRRLAAVETLGSTTVICSDKTGTLTKNEMTVTAVHLPTGREISVSGTGYDPHGHFLSEGVEIDPEGLGELLDAVVLCNDAQLQGPRDPGPRWRPIGDPTEVALLSFAMKGGVIPAELRADCPRRAELPFDPVVKMMASQHDTPDGPRVFIKGAPEVLLDLCHLTEGSRRSLREAADRMAARALRVLAVGVVEPGEIEVLDEAHGFETFRGRVSLLGLVGQIDPPRLEVKDAVAQCRAAGIRPVMVTGDHKATGQAIAVQLGILRDGDAAIDGRELEQLSDAELGERIDRISVFARVQPAQKLRIVDAFQRRSDVVAMTGDGVNDAPALVKADVGVAMGMTGTEVAKEAAKIVIGDDNFATIVAAVEEGRVVYRNLKKLILYLFTTATAEVVVLLTALLLNYSPPLAAVQILWVNLVTDGMFTVTLIMDPAEGDEMRQPPVPRSEPLLNRALLKRVAFMAPTMAAVTLGWFIIRQAMGKPFSEVQTETFTVMAMCQWFNVLSCRSATRSALSPSLMKNPWLIGGLLAGVALQAAVVYFRPLGKVFHTVPFELDEFLGMLAVASLVLWVEELRKLIVRRLAAREPRAAGR
jgi:Ca2+-transporting ATPase